MAYDAPDYDEVAFKKMLEKRFEGVHNLMQDLEEIWSPIGQGGIPYIRAMAMFAKEAAVVTEHAMTAILSYTGREDVQFTVKDNY